MTLNQSLGKETKDTDAKVGCILALPTRGEGIKVQENAKKDGYIESCRPPESWSYFTFSYFRQ